MLKDTQQFYKLSWKKFGRNLCPNNIHLALSSLHKMVSFFFSLVGMRSIAKKKKQRQKWTFVWTAKKASAEKSSQQATKLWINWSQTYAERLETRQRISAQERHTWFSVQ